MFDPMARQALGFDVPGIASECSLPSPADGLTRRPPDRRDIVVHDQPELAKIGPPNGPLRSWHTTEFQPKLGISLKTTMTGRFIFVSSTPDRAIHQAGTIMASSRKITNDCLRAEQLVMKPLFGKGVDVVGGGFQELGY